MGIKGGASLFKANSKVTSRNLNEFILFTRVCVDASEFLHRSLMKAGDNHVSGFLNLLEKLFRHGILPLFVFDGSPPKEKKAVIDERRKNRTRAREKFEKLTADTIALQKVFDSATIDSNAIESLSSSLSEEDYNTLLVTEKTECDDIAIKSKLSAHITNFTETAEKERRKTVSLAEKQIDEIKKLLDLFGIPYMALGIEADVVCAKLVKYGFVDYCISNDVDLLAFGCTKLIRNLKFSDDEIEIFEYESIVRDLGISHAQFIDLCILMGCDYTQRIIGIKPPLALTLIKEYGCIESILENIDSINSYLNTQEDGKYIKIPDNFNYVGARNVFNCDDVPFEMLQFEFEKRNFSTIQTVCQNTLYNRDAYTKLFAFCREHCHCLNDKLITKKINTVLYCFDNKTHYGRQNGPITGVTKMSAIHNEIYNDVYRKQVDNLAQVPFTPQKKQVRCFP